MNFVCLTYQTSFGASHVIQPISIIKRIGLVIFRKIMAMLSEKRQNINNLCGQDVQILTFAAVLHFLWLSCKQLNSYISNEEKSHQVECFYYWKYPKYLQIFARLVFVSIKGTKNIQ